MVTASKLDKDRIEKIRNFTPKESTEYIESLVLDLFKGYKGGEYIDNPDAEKTNEMLDEFKEISLSDYPERNNVNAVINDRKMRYLAIAYLSAYYNIQCYKSKVVRKIMFNTDMIMLETLHHRLKDLLRLYYDCYSNYGFMENLLMDLSDDGLAIDVDIRNKYLFSKEYGINKWLMDYLDIKIGVIVDSILNTLDECDVKYLDTDNELFEKAMDEVVDSIHANIKDFYENSFIDFEISAYKQTGLLDAQLETISELKNSIADEKQQYLEIKDELMDLINGNGFEKLSVDKFESYSESNANVDLDEYMKKQPKYDVRNAKFIYPEISECEYLSLY